MSLLGESCCFEFSSDFPREQIVAAIDSHWCSPIGPGPADADGRYTVYVSLYMHLGPDSVILSDLVILATVISSLSYGDLYYYPDSLAEEYDEKNTVGIAVNEIILHPPEGYNGERYLLRREEG